MVFAACAGTELEPTIDTAISAASVTPIPTTRCFNDPPASGTTIKPVRRMHVRTTETTSDQPEQHERTPVAVIHP